MYLISWWALGVSPVTSVRPVPHLPRDLPDVAAALEERAVHRGVVRNGPQAVDVLQDAMDTTDPPLGIGFEHDVGADAVCRAPDRHALAWKIHPEVLTGGRTDE
jgi:hypothetical protein